MDNLYIVIIYGSRSNWFRPNNFQPRRKVLNLINKSNKQTPVKRLEPIFYEPNNTKVIQPNVQVSEPIKEAVEPVAEPVVEPRRSNRVRRQKQLEIEEPTTQPPKKQEERELWFKNSK